MAKTIHKIAEGKARNEAEKQSQQLKKVLDEIFSDPAFEQPALHDFSLKFTHKFFYQPRVLADFVSEFLHPPAFVL